MASAASGVAVDGVVVEGFVCPMCMEELVSAAALHAHFDKAHTSGDGSGPKGLLSAARRRLGVGRGAAGGPGQAGGGPDVDAQRAAVRVEWAPQTVGPMRKRTKEFRKKRQRVADHNDVNAAQLLNRVEKLLYEGPSTKLVGKAAQKARKEFEQQVVPWVRGADVPICPDCGQPFGFFRRRHHCRLCGSVLCMECSRSLDVDVAVTLVKPQELAGAPRLLGEAGRTGLLASASDEEGAQRSGPRRLRIADDHMRICKFCEDSLIRSREKRKKKLVKKTAAATQEVPVVVQMYDRMWEAMGMVRKQLPKYNDLVQRMMNQKSVESYESAALMRQRLTKTFDGIDLLSKKIMTLNIETQDPRSGSQRLQKAIYSVAREFLQLNMLMTQGLPPKEVLMKRFREHHEKAERAREARRKAVKAQQQQPRQQQQQQQQQSARPAATSVPNPGRAPDAVLNVVPGGAVTARQGTRGPRSSRSQGGAASSEQSMGGRAAPTPVGREDFADMLKEQREALHSHLRTAQKEGRLDEVRMIQAQLQEMQAFSPPAPSQTQAAATPTPSGAEVEGGKGKRRSIFGKSPKRTPQPQRDAPEPPTLSVAAGNARNRSETFAAVLAEQRTVLTAQMQMALSQGRQDDAKAIRKSLQELEDFAKQ